MSGGREVRTKIASIKKTQKITNAMELVAAFQQNACGATAHVQIACVR